MKLNGWQRIWVVILVLWLIPSVMIGVSSIRTPYVFPPNVMAEMKHKPDFVLDASPYLPYQFQTPQEGRITFFSDGSAYYYIGGLAGKASIKIDGRAFLYKNTDDWRSRAKPISLGELLPAKSKALTFDDLVPIPESEKRGNRVGEDMLDGDNRFQKYVSEAPPQAAQKEGLGRTAFDETKPWEKYYGLPLLNELSESQNQALIDVAEEYNRAYPSAKRKKQVESAQGIFLASLIPPAILYAFGWAIGWIRRGFKTCHSTNP